MQILYRNKPTQEQLSQIKTIYHNCCLAEPLSLSCPSDDSSYILLYDNQKLVSFVSLFFPDHTLCECIAFTCPNSRHRGYFSICLEEICRFLELYEQNNHCETELCFLTDGKSQAASSTLNAIEAQYWYSEYQMEASVSRLSSMAFTDSRVTLIPKENGLFCIEAEGEPAGSFSLYKTKHLACLYELLIVPRFRSSGIATAALCLTARYLMQKQISILQLQVSDNNRAALKLYKKTGFQVMETLSYYLY